MLPLLLLLGLAALDFGRALRAANALSSAARAGADYGATRRVTPATLSPWQAQIELRVAQELSDTAEHLDNLLVSVVHQSEGSMHRVTVVAECEFRTALAWPGLPSPVMIRRSCTTRQYR